MGKLNTRWLGPYEVKIIFPNGVVKLTTIDLVKLKLLVNVHRLRLYKNPTDNNTFIKQFRGGQNMMEMRTSKLRTKFELDISSKILEE